MLPKSVQINGPVKSVPSEGYPMSERSAELKLLVPTYNANWFPVSVEAKVLPEFGEPFKKVLVRESDGLRIVLGSHDYHDYDMPDVQIERQPNGWVIFHNPNAGDPCGILYFRDDGQAYLLRELEYGTARKLIVLEPGTNVPGFEAVSVNHTQSSPRS